LWDSRCDNLMFISSHLLFISHPTYTNAIPNWLFRAVFKFQPEYSIYNPDCRCHFILVAHRVLNKENEDQLRAWLVFKIKVYHNKILRTIHYNYFHVYSGSQSRLIFWCLLNFLLNFERSSLIAPRPDEIDCKAHETLAFQKWRKSAKRIIFI